MRVGAQGFSPSELEQRRQIEREQQQSNQLEKQRDVRLDRPSISSIDAQLPIETPCFIIKRLVFQDTQGQAVDQFEKLRQSLINDVSAPFLGQCVGSQGVKWLIDRGQKRLIEQGFVTTRLLAGPQDMSEGSLRLTVVPGHIHAIRFKQPQDPRANAVNVFPMQVGDLLNLRDIEQALENFKRIPTADADIQIEPAQGEDSKVGDSDLVVSYTQAMPLRMTFSVDDSGTKETGKFQGASTFSFDNMLTLNDLFYFTHNGDLGGGKTGPRSSQSDTFHYSLPYGYWLLGATFTNGNYYQSVAGLNQNYIYSGTNANNEVKLSRMLIRDKDQKLNLSITAFQRTTDNAIDGTEVAVQKRVEGGCGATI